MENVRSDKNSKPGTIPSALMQYVWVGEVPGYNNVIKK